MPSRDGSQRVRELEERARIGRIAAWRDSGERAFHTGAVEQITPFGGGHRARRRDAVAEKAQVQEIVRVRAVHVPGAGLLTVRGQG
ncbi:hypothetical protein GCM10010112_83850 [Actinoplanes lobatus]|nr:hypothetical protein GCM10010112_83850 [Actinoplanes lobatus]